MKASSLQTLFVSYLRDLLGGEQQIMRSVPKIARGCSSLPLRQALSALVEQANQHLTRLEQIFDQVDQKAKPRKARVIREILEEAQDILDNNPDAPVLEAELLGTALKIIYYEIAVYRCVSSWAKQLDLHEAATLLQTTLEEELASAKKFTDLFGQEAPQEEETPAAAGAAVGAS